MKESDFDSFVDSPQKEKRSEPRFQNKYFMIEFKKKGLLHAILDPQTGEGRDISINGIRFATTSSLKKGDRLEARILFMPQFPGDKEIMVTATVVRVYRPEGTKRNRIGCSLGHLSTATKHVIQEFIAWQELLQSQPSRFKTSFKKAG